MPPGRSTTAISLPEDAIFDILSWTPVKSVCRFRCVCKDWLALVSDPAFVVKHKSRAASEQVLVCCCYEIDQYHEKSGMLVIMDMKGNMVRTIKGFDLSNIVHSSLDNLVCVSGPDAVTRVVDVTTGNIVVTCLMEHVRFDEAYAISISLGRAALSNSTKLVRFTEYSLYGDIPHTCEVLTLGEDGNMWRQVRPPPTAVYVLCNESTSATVNGVVHYLSAPYWVQYKPAYSVLRFDLESEEWSKTIQGPLNEDNELWSKTGQVRLTGLKGTLCMIQTEECQTKHRYTNIWLLADASKSIWVKTYVITMAMSFDIMEPLTVIPDGVKLLLYCRSKTSRASVLRVYDPSAGTRTDAMKLPENTFFKISVCSLDLDCFATPARSNGSHAESSFSTRIGSLDASH